jgi:hypothetical protein
VLVDVDAGIEVLHTLGHLPVAGGDQLLILTESFDRLFQSEKMVFFMLSLYALRFGQVANQANLPNGIAAAMQQRCLFITTNLEPCSGTDCRMCQCADGLLPMIQAAGHIMLPVHWLHNLDQGEVNCSG